MYYNIYNLQNKIINNNLKSKFIYKNSYKQVALNKFIFNIKLTSLKNLKNKTILNNLFLLELFTQKKCFIKNYKRKFNEIDVSIKSLLNKYNKYNFLFILQVFYFPMLYKHNLQLPKYIDNDSNFLFKLSNLNFFPFLPNIFFNWKLFITVVTIIGNNLINRNNKNYLVKKNRKFLLILLYLKFFLSKKFNK